MNRRYMRSGVAIAAALMLQVALGDDIAVPNFTPPRIVHLPDSFDACHSQTAGDLKFDNEPSVALTIAADGTLDEFTLPEGSPGWMKELSGCVVEQLRFLPGTRDGKPMESSASLKIKFCARGAVQAADIDVERVGPLITPPRLRNRGVDTDSCFPDRARQPRLSRFDVNITIMPDGSVTDVTLPAASEPWQDETARCVLGRVTFIAGTRDGLPVAAQATMPIVAKTKLGDVSSPKLRSSNETLEAAYRACYPADLLSMTSAFYSFTVATNGRVSNPKVAKSSGDTRLDEAGVCILKMLEFAPLMQDGRGMKSIVTWELPIRPPR